MRKRKRQSYAYPEPAQLRVGCKVSWYYYPTKALAEQAAKVARAEAVERSAEGYDFGFQAPGSITGPDNGFYPGLWEVCLP